MRRTLCLLLALCLLPMAGFAEIKKPQHMNALTFLHRYLYAMEEIGAAEAAYTYAPILYTDISEDEIYVMFNSLRLTLDRNTHDILYIDCAYSYEDNENVDILYQMVPAVIFALSENDLSQEYHRNLLNKGTLVPYKNPAAAHELIDAIIESGGEVNGYYGSANGEGEIQFRLNWFNSPPRAPFFPPDDAQPMTRGVHLYQFYTAFYFALSFLAADLIEDSPQIDPLFAGLCSLNPTHYASQEFIPYDVGRHSSLSVDKITFCVYFAESAFHVPREELSYLDYKEALSLCFALSGRPIWGELSVAPSESFLRVPESIAAFDSYLSTLYDHKTIGSYEFSLSEEFSHMVLFSSDFIH
ncbi:MAG: hypothetical protein IJF65_08320 [Clostridia bacterium]|nr:hypothetical protein [Clostridia bacterium]